VTFEEGLLVSAEALGDVEGDWLLSVSVIVDDEIVVPVVRNVDPIGCTVKNADLGQPHR
jgi:hypothetical protein